MKRGKMFTKIGAFFKGKEQKSMNRLMMKLQQGEMRLKQKKKEMRSLSPPIMSGAQSPDPDKKEKKRKFYIKLEPKQPNMNDVRASGFDPKVVKKMIMSKKTIDDSIHKVRKDTFFLNKVRIR